MNIAFVSAMKGETWGGSEELWSQAAGYLASQGHRVVASVVGWPSVPSGISAIQKMGVEVSFRYPANPSVLDRALQKGRRIATGASSVSIEEKWLGQVRPDFVCASDGAVAGVFRWLACCERMGIPCATVGQANAEYWWPDDEFAKDLRHAFSSASRCFFVSQTNRQLFERMIGAVLPNAEVVANPFKVEWNSAPPWPSVDPENECWKLACVGRLDPKAKGQDLIVEVLSRPHWAGVPLRVTLFGTGPCERTLRSLVAMEGLQDRIQFGGQVSDIANVWANHHALLLPSRYEGLPLAVVEALLCERVVISTAVAGTPEVVKHGKTGYLAQAATADLLDLTLQYAWNERGQWEEVGRRAGASIRELIPPDPVRAFAERILKLAG